MKKTFKIIIAIAIVKAIVRILKSQKTKEWIMLKREAVEDKIDELKAEQELGKLTAELNLDSREIEKMIEELNDKIYSQIISGSNELTAKRDDF